LVPAGTHATAPVGVTSHFSPVGHPHEGTTLHASPAGCPQLVLTEPLEDDPLEDDRLDDAPVAPPSPFLLPVVPPLPPPPEQAGNVARSAARVPARKNR
jgi:hypothetical protein